MDTHCLVAKSFEMDVQKKRFENSICCEAGISFSSKSANSIII
jgi:hypothetical protein